MRAFQIGAITIGIVLAAYVVYFVAADVRLPWDWH